MSHYNEICLRCLATGVKRFIEPGAGPVRHAKDAAPRPGELSLLDHEPQPISFRDERAQLAMLVGALFVVRRAAPSAAVVELEASDQGTYGFVLAGVWDGHGADLLPPWDETAHPLVGLADEVWDLVNDLDWDGVVGEDTVGYATIDIDQFLARFGPGTPQPTPTLPLPRA